MNQAETINTLGIHLPNYIFDKRIYRYRVGKGIYCYKVESYLKNSVCLLSNQLSDLINENDIDLAVIRQNGLLSTIKKGMSLKQESERLQTRIIKHFSVKEKVIDNMLFAIITIDYSLNFNSNNCY